MIAVKVNIYWHRFFLFFRVLKFTIHSWARTINERSREFHCKLIPVNPLNIFKTFIRHCSRFSPSKLLYYSINFHFNANLCHTIVYARHARIFIMNLHQNVLESSFSPNWNSICEIASGKFRDSLARYLKLCLRAHCETKWVGKVQQKFVVWC